MVGIPNLYGWGVIETRFVAALRMARTSPSCKFTIYISTYWLAAFFAPEHGWS
jgi:hypothetical protein